MNRHEDAPYLKHILDAIKDIDDSILNLSKQQFENNKDVKDATIRRIEIIGEATKNLSSKLKSKYTDVQWSKIAGARDVMIHAYFNVDLDIVWNIIKNDLPKLKREIKKILKEVNC